jgi:hypothetical protein
MGGCLWTGVYNVVCDIPEQAVTVSSNLPPQTIVGLVRRVFLNAHIVNYINPYSSGAGAPRTYPAEPSFGLSGQPTRAYDDSYSYWGHTNYTPAYESAYRGRSYDNEFRPSYYAPSSSYGYPWQPICRFSVQVAGAMSFWQNPTILSWEVLSVNVRICIIAMKKV